MKGRFKMISREMRRDRYIGIRKAFAEFMKCYPFTTEDLDGEEWRPIEGFDGYQVSSYGRVKSFKRGKPRIMKFALSPNNYIVYSLRPSGVYSDKQMNLHRLVAEAFIPNPDNKPQVNHRDGCKINACASNLEWATNAENIQHAYDTGLEKKLRNENAVSAKLTNEQVVYIRNNPDGLSTVELGKRFNVTSATISDVQLGKKYKEVGGVIREKCKYSPRIPDDIRVEMKTLHAKAPKENNYNALGRKYGYSAKTIWRIVNEG